MNNQLENLVFFLKLAANQEEYTRKNAMAHIQQYSAQHDFRFFDDITSLLASSDYTVHVLAYSYLLNQVIQKLRRVADLLFERLNKVFLMLSRQAQKPQNIAQLHWIQKMQTNTLNLAIACYSKPCELKARNQLLANSHVLLIEQESPQKIYYRFVFQGLVNVLTNQEKKMSASMTRQIQPVIFNLWEQGGLINYQIAINLSHFLSIFPGKLFISLVEMLHQPHIPLQLFNRIVSRIASALTIDLYKPKYQVLFNLYERIKAYAFLTDMNQMQPQFLIPLLKILSASLKLLLTYEPTQVEQIYMADSLISITNYNQLIQWLLTITAADQYEDQVYKEIKQLSKEIIEVYSWKFPQQQLNEYYCQLINGLNIEDEQKMIAFLYEAPTIIRGILQVEVFMLNILDRSLVNQCTAKSITELLFIQKYVQYSHYVDQHVLQKIHKYIMLNLNINESQLASPKDKQSQHNIMIRIAVLLSIQMAFSKYPQHSTILFISPASYITYISTYFFKYLANAYFGLSEIVSQRLFDNLMALIARKISNYNTVILGDAVAIYIAQFIQMGALTNIKQKQVVSTKQQMLAIIKESLSTSTDLENEVLNINLKRVLSDFDPQDPIISKEMLYLYSKFMQIYNKNLMDLGNEAIQQMQDNVEELQLCINLRKFEVGNNMDLINKGVLSAAEEILFTDKPQEFIEFISLGLEYDFIKNVADMLGQYVTVLKLLIEFSIHSECFEFITIIALKFVDFMQKNSEIFGQLLKLAERKRESIERPILQLRRLPIYLDCLLQVLYINPSWRNYCLNSQNTKIQQLFSRPEFIRCRNRIDSFVVGDVTQMLQQMSLDTNNKNNHIARWDKAYADILEDSSVGKICNSWIKYLKQQQM